MSDTPLMQQWRQIKSQHPDALLFFRVGDFYELFYEDAEEGARRLELTLTSRNNGSSRAPLAGIPAHALDTYLQRLVSQGCRVAICDQVEDPSTAKGIVRREVTELVTPGTVFSESLLDARKNNFLAVVGTDGETGFAVAAADLSTGEIELEQCGEGGLPDVLERIHPSEIIVPRGFECRSWRTNGTVRTERDAWLFEPETASETIRRHYGTLNLEGFGLDDGEQGLIGVWGALLSYVEEVQPGRRAALRTPRMRRSARAMHLDAMTRRNLELVEPLRPGASSATLLAALDRTRTAMGARLLRRWLLTPLLEVGAIEWRQERIGALVVEDDVRRRLRAVLDQVRDLERLAVRIASGRAGPRDLLNLGRSLSHVPDVRISLSDSTTEVLSLLARGIDDLAETRELIEEAIDPEAPPSLSDGGVIRSGYDTRLDELRDARDGGRDWIARLQQTERERTGIGSLKVGFNRVFGYYIEVTKTNVDRTPPEYERRQTLANAERYVIPALKEWEAKVLGAEERIAAREAELFAEVRERLGARAAEIQDLAGVLAELDVLAGLADVAVREGYTCPVVHEGFGLEIEAGRHPVVERMLPPGEFVPNDVRLDAEERLMVLTGPNMAGKSTVLRQVGLINLLAQIGSFVPARRASLGIVDRIFTRVGASDNLAHGQSTFMVEMNETAAILRHATKRSLVLLDEIGRGTSTWDGLSVAIATAEDLHDRIGAKTIFATHYHEMTRLAERLEGVFNVRVEVREEADRIVFVRRLTRGGADRSYGVEVARLAGLPPSVVGRARQVLEELEAGGGKHDATSLPAPQLGLFEAASPHPAVTRLQGVDVDRLTPLEALNLLADLQASASS